MSVGNYTIEWTGMVGINRVGRLLSPSGTVIEGRISFPQGMKRIGIEAELLMQYNLDPALKFVHLGDVRYIPDVGGSM